MKKVKIKSEALRSKEPGKLSNLSERMNAFPTHRAHRKNQANPLAGKKRSLRVRLALFWQRMRDSNPRKRSQSPVCYRYTNPLHLERCYYIQFSGKVKPQFKNLSFRAFRVLKLLQHLAQGQALGSGQAGQILVP